MLTVEAAAQALAAFVRQVLCPRFVVLVGLVTYTIVSILRPTSIVQRRDRRPVTQGVRRYFRNWYSFLDAVA